MISQSRKGLRCVLSMLLAIVVVISGIANTGFVFAATSVKLEINGFQISTTAEGFRTVYSVGDSKGEATEFGLVYGLTSQIQNSDLIVGSANQSVYSYKATSAGKISKNFASFSGGESYAMTMQFIKAKSFYESDLSIRAYAKLKDGTYTYSNVSTSSVYKIADYLYQRKKMSTIPAHEYLYNNILSVCNAGYQKVDYPLINILYPVDNGEETEAPTEAPTQKPTEKPTEAPTQKPTEKPTEQPTTKAETVNTDYSWLTYYPVGSSVYSVASNSNEFAFQLLEDQGTQMLIVPNIAEGSKPIWPDYSDIKLNGSAIEQFAGAGIYLSYASLTREYNVFEAKSAVDGHTFRIIIKKGGEVTTTKPVETTKTPETTKANETPTHVYKNPGVQSEAADSEVASNISLVNYFDSIDTDLSSTTGKSGEGIENLFDNNTRTKFFTGDAPTITISWKMKRAVVLNSYTFVLAGDAASYTFRDPHSWLLCGSMDGENWTTLSKITNGGLTHVNYGEYTFNTDKKVQAQYFMLMIKDSGDDGKLYYGSQMSEIKLTGDVSRITENVGKDITNQVSSVNSSATTVQGYNSNEGVENLFDSKDSTKLFTTSGTPSSIVWTMKQDTTIYSYTLRTANDNASFANRTVKSWQLYGSGDGNNWTLIDTVTESGMKDVNYSDYTYLVDKVGAYKHYKLTITGKYGTGFQLSALNLKGNTVEDKEFKALFVGDWDKVTASGYKQELYDAFYNIYPRQFVRFAKNKAPKRVFINADQGYDGVAYTAGNTVVIATAWMNAHPTGGVGYFTHELTHVTQQYGNVSSSGPAWWVENMANYGGFRYYHWAYPENVQVYFANDTSLQDWGYEAYGNNKWFFAYMDARYPSRKDSNGNITYGLIDSLNNLLKDNPNTKYDDNPYTVGTPWNEVVRSITGYDCIESLRLHYVQELKNGTWAFTGFKYYEDNWMTENVPGLPNLDYPMYVGKQHGNTTHAKLSSNVTSGTNLMSGASVIGTSGYVKDSEAASKFIDGDLSTKWCATSGSVSNQEYALTGAQHFVKIDLGSSKTFNTYTLYNTTSKEGYGNTTEWEILISNDNKNWTSVDYQVNNNNAISSYNIGSQTARYIVFKVFNADNGGSGTARLYELQLYNK